MTYKNTRINRFAINNSIRTQTKIVLKTVSNELDKFYKQKLIQAEFNKSIKKIIDDHMNRYKLKPHPTYLNNNLIFNQVATAKVNEIKKRVNSI
jgi:hypothetical protein